MLFGLVSCTTKGLAKLVVLRHGFTSIQNGGKVLRQVLVSEFCVVLWQKARVDDDALPMAPDRHDIEKGEEDRIENLSVHRFTFNKSISFKCSKIVDLFVPNHVKHRHTIYIY